MNELLTFLSGLTMQAIFFISLGYIAYALCQKWFSESSAGIRWSATSILFCWLLSIIFSILMSVHMFAPLPATITALISIVLTSRALKKPKTYANSIIYDFSCCRNIIIQENNDVWKIALTCFLLLAVLMTVRTLSLPLLGWDSMTYHGLKAGLWVQTKGWPTLNAPGGWEFYKSYFGGGEVFTAWCMLFLHSDLLAGIPDVFFWILVGLTTTCLAIEFDMRTRTAMLVGMAFLCTLELSGMVGTGYVDNCANSFLLGGILFLVRFYRSNKLGELFIAAAAFGLASSVKVNMLATSVLVALPVGILLLKSRRLPIKMYGLCLLGFIAPFVPWLLFNYISTGYPLGSIPLSIGPIHLGAPPPSLIWYLDRPDITPYKFSVEARAMYQSLHPFGLTLLLPLLGIPGFLLGVVQRRYRYILVFIIIASITGFYFSSSFSVVRLGWLTGRFLAPAIILITATGLPVLQRFRHGTPLIEAFSASSVITGVWTFIQDFILNKHPDEHPFDVLFLVLALLLILVFFYIAYRHWLVSSARKAVVTALCVVASVSTLYAFYQFKNSFHIQAYSKYIIKQSFPRYWVDGLRALESETKPLRIAFTYGAEQDNHYAFLAPFLGIYLNNYLLYVSPYKDGFIVPHHPDYLANSSPSFESWINGLQNAKATHVLSLRPPSKELLWMQDHPNVFVNLAGQADSWGVFRIELSNKWPRIGYEP